MYSVFNISLLHLPIHSEESVKQDVIDLLTCVLSLGVQPLFTTAVLLHYFPFVYGVGYHPMELRYTKNAEVSPNSWQWGITHPEDSEPGGWIDGILNTL
jgi:hypothetical protein